MFYTCCEQLGKVPRLFEQGGVLLSVPSLVKALVELGENAWPPQLRSLSSRPV